MLSSEQTWPTKLHLHATLRLCVSASLHLPTQAMFNSKLELEGYLARRASSPKSRCEINDSRHGAKSAPKQILGKKHCSRALPVSMRPERPPSHAPMLYSSCPLS